MSGMACFKVWVMDSRTWLSEHGAGIGLQASGVDGLTCFMEPSIDFQIFEV